MTTDLSRPKPDVPGFPCVFSEDRAYRYVLWRHWGQTANPKFLMVIGLNPSTADEENDDPTLRRCIDFAKRWGYDALCMTNLFAWRATKPRDMQAQDDPVGPFNDVWLVRIAERADGILAAWGTGGRYRQRDKQVIEMLKATAAVPLTAMALNANGTPMHPLYVWSGSRPYPFPPPE